MKRPIIEEDYSKQKIRIKRRLAAQKSIERKKALLKNKDMPDSYTLMNINNNIPPIDIQNSTYHSNDDVFAGLIFL